MRSNPITNLQNRRRSEDGFTLIELLVVVVILGILIGIAIPVYLNYRKNANDRAAQSDVRGAIATLEVCNSDGGYPLTVNATTGVMADGCTQTAALSSNTTLAYRKQPTGAATSAAITSYILVGYNSGGTQGAASGNKYYCYNSNTGGSVKQVLAADAASATC